MAMATARQKVTSHLAKAALAQAPVVRPVAGRGRQGNIAVELHARRPAVGGGCESLGEGEGRGEAGGNGTRSKGVSLSSCVPPRATFTPWYIFFGSMLKTFHNN